MSNFKEPKSVGGVKEYWDKRAAVMAENPSATTNDVYLRELEAKTLIARLKELNLPKKSHILDVGCGNGYTLVKVAKEFEHFSFRGVDYSEEMIRAAKSLLEKSPDLKGRLSFAVGDATNLEDSIDGMLFNVVMSDRCLINLESFQAQAGAIAGIARHVIGGGYYIAIENFMKGQRNFTEAREALGLPEIPVRWHNLFFDEERFVAEVEKNFTDIEIISFASSYYFATRVVYSKSCQMQGVEPDYEHPIHKLSIDLPPTGDFCPIKMAVMKRK